MKIMRPQDVADFFQTCIVKQGKFWYGTDTLPSWNADKQVWEIEGLVWFSLSSHNILYMGADEESLTIPRQV